ncbi:hypothetical protein EVAR_35903_1 [Eumeta japonica]|uniref:Uncharacterized protein n=1 Tax=Eumeta variegata TaxID=151549 RepID=A0A4C1WTN0_EUMVA|nr:hypothetical protein EVAR_35903_1 [Eumeta japonica]
MSTSEDDANRRKSQDSELLVQKILDAEKRALAASSTGESSKSSVETYPRKTGRKKPASVVVQTPERMRTSAKTESGAFVSLQAVGEFAGRLSLCDEIERPPAQVPGTAATKTQDLTHVSVRDDRLTEVPEASISRTASIVNKLALEAKTELEKLTNMNKTVKEAVISKLHAIGELVLRLEDSRYGYAAGLKREKASKAQEIAALESQQKQTTERQFKQCLNLTAKMDIIEKEVKATRNILGFYDVPETLQQIRKAVEQPPKKT